MSLRWSPRCELGGLEMCACPASRFVSTDELLHELHVFRVCPPSRVSASASTYPPISSREIRQLLQSAQFYPAIDRARARASLLHHHTGKVSVEVGFFPSVLRRPPALMPTCWPPCNYPTYTWEPPTCPPAKVMELTCRLPTCRVQASKLLKKIIKTTLLRKIPCNNQRGQVYICSSRC